MHSDGGSEERSTLYVAFVAKSQALFWFHVTQLLYRTLKDNGSLDIINPCTPDGREGDIRALIQGMTCAIPKLRPRAVDVVKRLQDIEVSEQETRHSIGMTQAKVKNFAMALP